MLALLRIVGATLGWFAWIAGIRKSVTLDNLQRALPELRSKDRLRIARRSFVNLGIVFFEFLYLRSASREAIGRGLHIINRNENQRTVDSPHGVIFLSGHLANWEWLAIGCGVVIDRPVNVIVKNQTTNAAERFLMQMRTRFGNQMIDAADVRRTFRALRDGEPLGILGDQTPFAEAVRVPFFGMQVPTFEGAARIALRTRAPILFMQLFRRTTHGYECRFVPIPFDDLAEASEENVRELTARHTAALERAIREKPEFWLWQHKRFKYV